MSDNTLRQFTAPNARILLVDDMPVNNKVTEKLLEPLKMHIELASNGKEALDKIFENKYDLVFMDHMMPVMDGVEAVKKLRNRPEEVYKILPVVVVTGNTTDEEKKHYLESGFSDHLSKPIDINDILSCILKWLPEEKVQKAQDTEEKTADTPGDSGQVINIPGIDTKKGIKHSGGPTVFMELLGDVHDLIDDKSSLIGKYLADDDIIAYTTQVHALKTTCRMIGAMDLAEGFHTLEKLGNSNEKDKLEELTPGVLETFMDLKQYLEPYAQKKTGPDKEFNKEEILLTMKNLAVSIKDFDLTKTDELMNQASSYNYPDELAGDVDTLRKLINDIDYVEAKNVIEKIIASLQ